MKTVPFYKMQASGNDFVVVDNRRRMVADAKRFARKVCAPHTGIGADGILLFEKSSRADFKMRIVNSDGSEAEACGNGFRCISLFAHKIQGYPKNFRFESLSGMIDARIAGRKIRVGLVQPSELRQGNIQVMGRRMHYYFINTGVPHTVIFVQGLKDIDVSALGAAIRHHKEFAPRGTNVNFVEIDGARDIHVRTYERGVEQETLACGTGSTASAIVSSLTGCCKPPVRVHTSGGEILTIDFERKGKVFRKPTLEGEAHFVYEGKLLDSE